MLYTKIFNLYLNFKRKNSKEFPAVIVSIGNITAGGAGKTPFVIELCILLQNSGYRCAVVSRGYKGKYKDEYQFVSKNGRIILSPAEAGDEPVLIARKTGAPVVVARKRSRGITALLNQFPLTDVVLLDDAFSHIQVKRDVDILLIDSWRNLRKEKPLPFGVLREPLENIKRADLFFANMKGKFFTENKIFLKSLGIDKIYTFSYLPLKFINLRGEEIKAEVLKKLKVIAMAGIAHPGSFFKLLDEMKTKPLLKIPLPDHFSYPWLVRKILQIIISQNFYLLVTEKDAVKLDYLLPEEVKDRIIYTSTSLEIQEEGKKELLKSIARAKESKRKKND